ncbi:hypothetical protein GXW82_01220 [Streptacidiphilus sp. 4-A2]|nr:hypothetical protein [Streptacidiphilus sp. 4-A2]
MTTDDADGTDDAGSSDDSGQEALAREAAAWAAHAAPLRALHRQLRAEFRAQTPPPGWCRCWC